MILALVGWGIALVIFLAIVGGIGIAAYVLRRIDRG